MIELALIAIVMSIAVVLWQATAILTDNNKTAMLYITTFITVGLLWFLVYAGDIYLQDARYDQPANTTADFSAIHEDRNYSYETKYTELQVAWHSMYNIITSLSQILLILMVLATIYMIFQLLAERIA